MRRTLLAVVALGVIGPIVAFMIAYVAVDVPDPSDIQNDQVATILYADGSELARVVPPEGNRTEVAITDVPDHVQKAVLAAEDRSFETNPGFSITGIARATLNNLSGGDPQGASTITQQYVKNALVGDDQTITRKMKELVIATKMSRQASKDEILVAYLNTIYFGRGAYGVSAAAEAYFGKPVSELSVSEGAVLASSIRSPSAYDPATDLQAAQDRWTFVLEGMVEQGWLSVSEANAQGYPTVIPLAEVDTGSNIAGPEGLVVRQVRQELTEMGISEQQLNQEGLQITTTLDARTQQAAVDASAEVLADQPEGLRNAVVSVDPRSGAVRAYYGGTDGVGFDYALAKRSAGSAMKVFTTAAALEQGIPLSETYDGSSPRTIAGTEVSNSEGVSCPGQCSVAEALKRSLNTVFFELAVDVGPQAVVDVARTAGIPETFPDGGKSLVDGEGQVVAGVTLGVGSVRPIDMASAYATFANDGTHAEPYFIQQVVTADGDVLLDRGDVTGEEVIDPVVAQNVTAAMEPIADYSRDHGLADGRPSAAKTGTNQLADTGQNRDAWMVGYTPSLSTAVWIGQAENGPIVTADGDDIFGSGLPADIWQQVMNAALDGTEIEEFPEAPPIEGQDRGGIPAGDDSGGGNDDNGGNGGNGGNDNGGNDNGGGNDNNGNDNSGNENNGGNGGGGGGGGNDEEQPAPAPQPEPEPTQPPEPAPTTPAPPVTTTPPTTTPPTTTPAPATPAPATPAPTAPAPTCGALPLPSCAPGSGGGDGGAGAGGGDRVAPNQAPPSTRPTG